VGFLSNKGVRTGLFFGATSGVITTLGLMTGLNAGTHSLAAVLGGILVIAVADAMSDHIWAATVSTFLNKFVFALSFAIPLLLLPLDLAVMASVVWGMLVITVLSYFIARVQEASPIAIIVEHLAIALLVVVLSHFIGVWVGKAFG
jgi:VIT1/CCC1 family predicted Fe2+/Mn2+ transporter